MKELSQYFTTLTAAFRFPPTGQVPAPPSPVLEQIDGLCLAVPDPAVSQAAPGRLNVAVICREYPPDTAYGGMATFSYHLAHGLALEGHRVVVISQGTPRICRDFDGRVDVVRIQPRLHGQRGSFERLCRKGRLSFAKNVFFYSLGVYKQLLALEDRWGPFDVIDLPDHAAEGIIPVLFWPGAKTVRLYSPWSMLHAMRANFYADDDVAEFKALERAALTHAHVVTSPSRDLSARTRTFFGLERDIPFVPNPLDTDLFCPVTRVPGPVRVGFAGRLEVRKGITTLFEAIPAVLAKNPDLEFRIVGRDVCSFRSIFRPVLDAQRVQFLDPVPLTELPAVYQAVDIAVVPSHYDNSPYTCIEPMACGIPVIGTEAGGMPEYVAHGETGLIVPGRDAGALAEAILRLAGDPVERARLGTAARQQMVRRFDYRRVARQMAQHYRNAIALCRGQRPVTFECETRPQGRSAPAPAPDSLRGEMIILAGPGEVDGVEKTLAAARRLGKTLQAVSVLWRGADVVPAFRGCRVFSAAGAPATAMSAVFATVLADFCVCLRAGDVLNRTALTKGVGSQTPRSVDRTVCPLFRAEAVRGFPYFPATGDHAAKDVLQFLYDHVVRQGWAEAVLDEDLVMAAASRDSVSCRARPAALVTPVVSRSIPAYVSPGGTRPPVMVTRVPSWLRKVALWGLSACSGGNLRPLRRRVRAMLNACRLTRPMAAWLSRAKGSLGTGDFVAPEDERLGVLILTHSVAEGQALWRDLQAQRNWDSSTAAPTLVVVGNGSASAPAVRSTTGDVAIYCLDALVPAAYHPHAFAHLASAYARIAVFTTSNFCGNALLAALGTTACRPVGAAA
jgi:glycosyltransferase involved in cell wall biosynthesis